MKQMFRNARGQLRNGWWILAFAAVFLASQWICRPASTVLQQHGSEGLWLSPLPVVFLLLVTWACTRLRREPLASVGLRLDGHWFRHVALGIAFGTAMMFAAAGLIYVVGGVRFGPGPARGLAALAAGAWMFMFVALLEEVLFRGFVFQRMVDGIGPWPAQLMLAALFAVAHWGNPGMEGATQVWATIDTALGAILLGLANLRIRSLALPIGIISAGTGRRGRCPASM